MEIIQILCYAQNYLLFTTYYLLNRAGTLSQNADASQSSYVRLPRWGRDSRRRDMNMCVPSAKRIPKIISIKYLLLALVLFASCTGQVPQSNIEEIVFYSGPFKVVGDLKLPEGSGPHPVIVFVHGDGPNDRIAGGTYLPIMERMARAGYATFAWDKPGTGESTGQFDHSRIGEQRAQIVIDAIDVLKTYTNINPRRIGLWGISQAGYVMPRVLLMSDDIAFMIAVSCPGMAGVDQGAYLVSAQAICAGALKEEAEQMNLLLSDVESAQTYDRYVQYKKKLDALPGIGVASIFGYKRGAVSEDDWHVPNLQGEYFWNPIDVIEKTTIPVLAFFAEKDTQVDPIQGAKAYREALERADNQNFRVELIPSADHNIILSETGCLEEREKRQQHEWINYAPEYLDVLEEWLGELDHNSE
jgi:pimeloyl-ACP methyl ester carboxylesterase